MRSISPAGLTPAVAPTGLPTLPPQRPLAQVHLTDAADSFLAGLKIPTAASRRTYGAHLRRFLSWIEHTETIPADPDRALDLFRDHLQATEVGTFARAQYITTARRFLGHLHRTGSLQTAPTREGGHVAIPPALRREYRKDFLSVEQLIAITEDLQERASTGDPAALRDEAMIRIMATAGLRTTSLVSATWADLDTRGGRPTLRYRTKGAAADDRTAESYLEPATAAALDLWRTTLEALIGPLDDAQPIFPSLSPRNRGKALTTRSIRRAVKAAFASVGITSERITTHSLRHTAATRARIAGYDRSHVASMLDHASEETTKRYDHFTDRHEDPAELALGW